MLPRLLQPQKLINLRISFSIFPAKRKPETTKFHMTSNRFKPSLRPSPLPPRWENSSVFPNFPPPSRSKPHVQWGEDADIAGDERACFFPPFFSLEFISRSTLRHVCRLMRFRLHVLLTACATRTLKRSVFF